MYYRYTGTVLPIPELHLLVPTVLVLYLPVLYDVWLYFTSLLTQGNTMLFSIDRTNCATLLSLFVVNIWVCIVYMPCRLPNTTSVRSRSPTTASSHGSSWKNAKVSSRPAGFFKWCFMTGMPSCSSMAMASWKLVSSGVPALLDKIAIESGNSDINFTIASSTWGWMWSA